jgi:hypothetical protein
VLIPKGLKLFVLKEIRELVDVLILLGLGDIGPTASGMVKQNNTTDITIK